MSNPIHLSINGQKVQVVAGTMIAAAIAQTGIGAYRHSVLGESRAPLCGMGICFECRVTINGQAHCLSCQTLCEDGMEVSTT